MRVGTLSAFIAAVVAVATCSPRNDLDPPPNDAARDAQVDSDAEPSDAGSGDAGWIPRSDASAPDDVLVWAHSATELYSFDPRTNTVAIVGTFRDAEGAAAPDMTDLAVNRDGQIYTCSYDELFRVDPITAVATRLSSFEPGKGVRFYGMTFLPAGVLEPDRETLVGATNNGEYYRIDEASGGLDMLGQLSDGYGLSGDIVSVEGAGTFATVKRDDLSSDLLVELEPATGEVMAIGKATGFRNLFGLGYWRSRLFGFSSRGELVDIDIETGAGTISTNETGTDQFWGAGVTTIAPIGPF